MLLNHNPCNEASLVLTPSRSRLHPLPNRHPSSTAQSTTMLLSTAPFLLHTLIETPAALSFILSPTSQLSPCPPEATLILQSFGGLLLSTNLISLIFLRRNFDETSRNVALAFGLWHLWPCYRAAVRLMRKTDEAQTVKTLGGPVVHLAAHATLHLLFLTSFFCG